MIQFKSLQGLSTLVLGLGLAGSNFMVINLLGNNNSIPNLNHLATTENSSSQMRYIKNKDGAIEISMSHNMNDPKLSLHTSESSSPSWGGKTKTTYIHKELLPHSPSNSLTADYIACIKNKGSAESQGEIVGCALITATPASGFLSNLPVVGWLANSIATKKAATAGKNIASSFVDC